MSVKNHHCIKLLNKRKVYLSIRQLSRFHCIGIALLGRIFAIIYDRVKDVG